MNKKSIIFAFCIFLLFPFSIIAQNEEWGKHRIKFNPTRAMNWLYPGLEFGYEYYSGRFSSQLSVAYISDFADFNIWNSLNGYHILFEEKYFFKKQPRSRNMLKLYLSAEINYRDLKFNTTEWYLPAEYKQLGDRDEQEKYAYKEDVDIQRKAIDTNINMGVQFRLKKILFETSAGIGAGFQNVHHNKSNQDDIQFDMNQGFNISYLTTMEGFNVIPNFTMSIKVGYIF
jgi:hypothetical protein